MAERLALMKGGTSAWQDYGSRKPESGQVEQKVAT